MSSPGAPDEPSCVPLIDDWGRRRAAEFVDSSGTRLVKLFVCHHHPATDADDDGRTAPPARANGNGEPIAGALAVS